MELVLEYLRLAEADEVDMEVVGGGGRLGCARVPVARTRRGQRNRDPLRRRGTTSISVKRLSPQSVRRLISASAASRPTKGPGSGHPGAAVAVISGCVRAAIEWHNRWSRDEAREAAGLRE